MPKYILDTDALVDVLRKTPLDERGNYIRNSIRDAHVDNVIPDWMKPLPESLEKLGKWAEASKKGASIGGYSPAFLKFWEEYPARNGVRSGKAQAMKAWKKVKGITESELLKACLTALEWQKKDEQWTKDNGTYIPMATTYINQRRWEDEGSADGGQWEEFTDMNGAVKRRRKP